MTTPDHTPTTPLPAAKPASSLYIRTADALVAVGGLLMFLFSFAPFISAGSVEVGGHVYSAGNSQNAWGFETPVVLFVVFAAILLIATAFIDTFWHRDKQMVGLHRHHLQVGLALYALVTLFAFAVADKGGESFGWGGIFMLIGAIVAAAGAVLNYFEKLQSPLEVPKSLSKSKPTYPGSQGGYNPNAPQQGYAPPAQPGYAPPQQGYAQPPQGYQQQAPQGYVPPSDSQTPPNA